MWLNSQEIALEETKLRELHSQLTSTQLRAENSLRMQGIVWEKFKASQKEMTDRIFASVTQIRERIASVERNILLLKNTNQNGWN